MGMYLNFGTGKFERAIKSEIKNNPTPGKKLDFICQEMNREINTIVRKNPSQSHIF